MAQKNLRSGLPIGALTHDHSATSVDSTTFVTLSASPLSLSCDKVMVFDSSGEQIWIAWANTNLASAVTTGANAVLVPPGGFDGQPDLFIPANNYVFIKSNTLTTTSGQFILNLFKDQTYE